MSTTVKLDGGGGWPARVAARAGAVGVVGRFWRVGYADFMRLRPPHLIAIAVLAATSARTLIATPSDPNASAESRIEATAKRFLVDVPAKTATRDGLRGEDRVAYVELLEFLAGVSQADLAIAADGFRRRREDVWQVESPGTAYSAFADALANPETFQGRAVRLIGHANRIVSYDVAALERGGEPIQAYESWVVTDDSLRYPWVVVSNQISPNARVGEAKVSGVDAVGVVFQVFTYKARDGKTRYAPLVIANGWSTPAPPAASRSEWMLAALAAVFGLSISWTLVRLLRPKRRRALVASDPAIPFLEDSDAPDHE